MKKLTKNNLIIIAMICFAISAICSSMALSYSIKILEPAQNRIGYFSSQSGETNTDIILRALYIVNPKVKPILESKSDSIHSNKESFDEDMNEFNRDIEILSKNIKKYDRISLWTFSLGLFFSILAIIKIEKVSGTLKGLKS